MSRLTWDMAREKGKEDKKWIMVNLQDMSNFKCQALNRDIWRDEAVRKLVQKHFIFLQYSLEDPRAEQYINFYFPHRSHENPDNYPHVSIIDPRTGEQQEIWSGEFKDAAAFHQDLVNFLDRYSLSDNSKNPVGPSRAGVQRSRPIDVDRMTEEEMLEMALQNSLKTARGNGAASAASTGITHPTDVGEPDTGAASRAGSKPPTAIAAASPSQAAADTSAFAGISSTRPHTEPADNATTATRIQFRHPAGRVIRRFQRHEPVRRIYEWLKSGGLEAIFGADAVSGEGAEFELKRMPEGLDLITLLDTTIEEAGLKQGTVMIELTSD